MRPLIKGEMFLDHRTWEYPKALGFQDDMCDEQSRFGFGFFVEIILSPTDETTGPSNEALDLSGRTYIKPSEKT